MVINSFEKKYLEEYIKVLEEFYEIKELFSYELLINDALIHFIRN